MSIQEILKLPAAEKILLVERIWESLEDKELELTSAQKKELDYRQALDRSGKMSWHSWGAVKEHLSSRRK